MFIHLLRSFVREEDGQDLIEYTLLLAFVVMSSSALFIDGSKAISQIWSKAQNNLDLAVSVAVPPS